MLETETEDVTCVARCLKGDASAFEPLVTRYQRVVYTVALRLLGNPEDARDATQNAFVRAYERLDTFDPSRRFFSWMYRIAVNESLNLRRAQRPHEPLPETLETSGGAVDRVEARELSERIQAALMMLSPEYRRTKRSPRPSRFPRRPSSRGCFRRASGWRPFSRQGASRDRARDRSRPRAGEGTTREPAAGSGGDHHDAGRRDRAGLLRLAAVAADQAGGAARQLSARDWCSYQTSR
jgi:RNA polymerase sigma-70 factor (ECF subfamily)